MAFGVKGESFIFHAKFYNGDGDLISVNTPTIDIFTFSAIGGKVDLVSSGSLTEITASPGLWVYLYNIPSDYSYGPNIYGAIAAVDPSDNTIIRLEQEVVVLAESENNNTVTVAFNGNVIEANASSLNFYGDGLSITAGAAGAAQIYIPPPSYVSHWDTSDGDNGNQSVSESLSRTTVQIPTPSGGEGNPFKTGGWAGGSHPATLTTTVTFTTPSYTTGWGGDSTLSVVIYDADGATDLETFTTPAITQDGTHTSPSGHTIVTISQYAIDSNTPRYRAKASIAIDTGSLLTNGGKYHVVITHTTDSTTDGTGPYVYTQDAVFLDTNPNTPSISGAVTIAENTPVTKHLSGVEYYTLNSTFSLSVGGIDNLNRNTIRTSGNLKVSSTNFSLSALTIGTGSLTGWADAENHTGASYTKNNWTLTTEIYRYRGTAASVSAYPKDPWASGGTVSSTNHSILIDTFGTTSTDLYEGFDDENRRQDNTFNAGSSAGNWNSSQSLVAGEGMLVNSYLMSPDQAGIVDWSGYQPDDGGANPNYTGLTVPVNYYRTFVDSTGSNQPNFTLTFTGDFVVDATDDLSNSLLEVFVRRINSQTGDFGVTANPLVLHGVEYNSSQFNDGVTNGQIRLGSSSGNTIQATFGGLACRDGIFVHIRINNTSIKINSLLISFPL